MSSAEVARSSMTKPFWIGKGGRTYLAHYNQILTCLEIVGVKPPAKILELGCGTGWMSEFLATTGFDVCGTTISEDDVLDANRRVKSLEVKGLSPALKFIAAPMESVHTELAADSFDAVFVYEALHHAFDWRQAIRSAHGCLRENGWLLICNEPNVLHTCVSYRVAKLSNTHEIGFSKGDLVAELRKTGFRKIISTGAKLHCWFRPHWLLAKK
jgi:cyclopropane fatty-acyl-phospholipid synthase-like methyltransferase